MIQLCPFCGHLLPHGLGDGLGSCMNCSRVFDSSPFNRLLSASWLCRKQHIVDVDMLANYGFKKEEAMIVINFVAENSYSHQEFCQVLKELGVSQVYVPSEEI